MPTYPFRCSECKQDFDVYLAIAKREEPQRCPHCGSARTERQVASGFIGGRSCSGDGSAGGL